MTSHQIALVSLSLATPLEPLAYRQNVTSLSLL